MPNEPENTNQDQYTAQIAAVLETNTKEQEHVRSQITDLQARLERLQHDHELLAEMCGSKAGTSVTPVKEPAAEAESTSGHADAVASKKTTPRAVPEPRRATAKKAPATPRRRQQKKATQTQPRRGAKQKAAAKKTGPALHALVQGLLTSEPLQVSELADAMAKAHPERPVTPQLVRNALENLVAKSEAERRKQGGSVFYTAADNDTPTVSVPGPAAESAPAEEKAAAGV